LNRFLDFAGGTMFTKRMSRKTYWISVAILAGVSLFIAFVPVLASASWGLTFVWLLLWAPRLHDIGKSAWLIAIPIVAQIGIGMAGFAAGGEVFMKIASGDITAIDENDPGTATVIMVILAAAAIQIGFTVLIGIPRGDPGPNRFGDAPKS
jgi:uncharacterized membrane protein YhaH (DUF805 family)